ncbi:MAG: hypothetical protein JSW00_09655 [Thermoplasmata archaeon]|nr:MAG: hypothetical protein JSW00_09655 [Thermoplasmata archaeon]
MKCIYCLEDKSKSLFRSTDHVIPQAFGRFQNNLTLNKLVCDDCNQYFGENIELYLGRDSLEGIARYNYGIRSKKEPLYRRVKMKIGRVGELGGVHVVLKDSNNADEPGLEAITQVGFFHPERKKYDYFTEKEIPERQELENQGYQLNNKKIVFYGDIELLVKLLKDKGINIKIEKIYEEIQNMPRGKIPVYVKARIDRIVYRGLSKIVFNYLTYHMGRKFVLREDFNGLRNFIRDDQGNGDRFFGITTNAILYRERVFRRRRLKGHIIVMKWENNNSDLIGRLTLYDAQIGLTYLIILCKNYRGVWIPIQKGHYFDPDTKKIRELLHTNLILP